MENLHFHFENKCRYFELIDTFYATMHCIFLVKRSQG